MFAWLTRLLPAVLLLGLVAAPAPAASTVKDEGKLFSAQAKQEANRILADVEQHLKKEVHVEAYNKPPADKAAEFERIKRDPKRHGEFFREWAGERFRATGTNGILILVFRESRDGYYVQVDVGQETTRQLFPADDHRRLVDIMREHM
jgi:hypothetical protein